MRTEEVHQRALPANYDHDTTLWYCEADCPHRCSVITTVSQPILVRAGHCIEFQSPKVRGKAVWKRGLTIESELKKRR